MKGFVDPHKITFQVHSNFCIDEHFPIVPDWREYINVPNEKTNLVLIGVGMLKYIDQYKSFLQTFAELFKTVFIVPGDRDLNDLTIKEARKLLISLTIIPNVVPLMDNIVEVEGWDDCFITGSVWWPRYYSIDYHHCLYKHYNSFYERPSKYDYEALYCKSRIFASSSMKCLLNLSGDHIEKWGNTSSFSGFYDSRDTTKRLKIFRATYFDNDRLDYNITDEYQPMCDEHWAYGVYFSPSPCYHTDLISESNPINCRKSWKGRLSYSCNNYKLKDYKKDPEPVVFKFG